MSSCLKGGNTEEISGEEKMHRSLPEEKEIQEDSFFFP